MNRTFLSLALAVSMLGLPACSADVHDNTLDVHDNTANIDDAKVEFETSTNVDDVQASEQVPVTIQAENVYLIDPSETPPPDRVKVAGHFQFYWDNMDGSPILVTAEESVSVQVPADAQPGDHKLLCRVHKHDGTPTEATFELDLTVKATVTSGS